MGKKVKGNLLALICAAVWGTSYIVTRNSLTCFSPLQLMWARALIAYAVLWVICPKWQFEIKSEIVFLLLGLFGNTLYYYTQNMALTMTSTANVSILISMSPVFTVMVLKMLNPGTKITSVAAAGYAIAAVGAVLVILNGIVNLNFSLSGDLLALAASICWGVYSVLTKKVSGHFSDALITRKLMFYGIVTTIPLLIVRGESADFISSAGIYQLIPLAYLGVVCSGLCFLMWNSAMKLIGVTKSSVYLYTMPVFTLCAGTVFLHESISPVGLCGFVLVLAGLMMSLKD